MTTDPTPLQERIARAQSRCRTFEPDVCDGCQKRLDDAAAVLPIIAAEVRKGQADALRAEALDISFIEIEDDYDRLDYSTSREFYEDMVRDHLRARAIIIEQEG